MPGESQETNATKKTTSPNGSARLAVVNCSYSCPLASFLVEVVAAIHAAG